MLPGTDCRDCAVSRGHNEPDRIASTLDRPAVLLAVMKQANANTIELVERIKVYMEGYAFSDSTGVDLILVDEDSHDQQRH